jgi:hypothetical protein
MPVSEARRMGMFYDWLVKVASEHKKSKALLPQLLEHVHW